MIFHMQRKKITNKIPNLEINNTMIEKVTDFNFLGITLNENLKWDSHTRKISMKLSKYIGILNKLKHFLPNHILKILYDSMILSHLNYGILTWGFSIEPLIKLQKKAIRIVTNSKFNAHTEPLFKSLNTLKISDIFKLNVLKFYYKHCKKELPHYLQSMKLSKRSEVHRYNTRHRNDLDIQRTNTKLADKCLRYAVQTTINNTEANILDKIATHSPQGFAWYIKQQYIKAYQEKCYIENCYVCQSN